MLTLDQKTAMAGLKDALAERLAATPPTATFPNPPSVEEYTKNAIVKACLVAFATGVRLYLPGSAGIGKTSFLKEVCQLLGLTAVYWNMANMSPENVFVMFPGKEDGQYVLKPRFLQMLQDPSQRIVLIMDEVSRSDQGMPNLSMEVQSEGSIAGVPVPGLVTVVAMDNPQGALYGHMSTMDFAQADRFMTVRLDATSTPWKRALAQAFPEVDLSKAFSAYDTLDPSVREVLSPRVLEHVIRALLEGLPAVWALPMPGGVRRHLQDKAGTDVTAPVLSKIAAALGLADRESVPDKMERVLAFAVKHDANVYVQGPPGVGKTKSVKAYFDSRGIEAVYESMPLVSPEDMMVPFPSEDGQSLDMLRRSKYVLGPPAFFIADEATRASRRTQNAFMEVLQERTLGGQPTRIRGTIALNNPREFAGMKLDVGKADLAQASRYALSIEVDAADTGWASWLRATYGEDVATPFVEWWEDDLDDVGRALVTPRCIERMIAVHESGGDIAWALPYLKGEQVKVPLVELHARLEKRPMARLRAIVANVDDYAEQLARGKDDEPMAHATVFMAFLKADLAQLESARDVCLRLYDLLDRQHRIDLIRQGGERQKFWNSILVDGAGQ